MEDRNQQIEKLKGYYRLHAMIYDATRWSFLFGRSRIIRALPDLPENARILEVGCGTGKNMIKILKKYPGAHVVGLDISSDMLDVARKKLSAYSDRTSFLEMPYARGAETGGPFDLILFSYALSMINPQWEEVLEQAKEDLKPGGFVAVVDFFEAGLSAYQQYMKWNHVRMEGHLLPRLKELFYPRWLSVKKAYFGVWRYFYFLGEKTVANQDEG